ncbi:MAG: hypothetical protein Q4E65_09570 [Clostridia bacterium]|nr:hypothetical protein [Clostridia bacterium]
MKPIVEMRMLGADTLLIATRIHAENRLQDTALGLRLLADGVAHLQTHAPYQLPDGPMQVCTQIAWAEKFSPDAINVRIEDKPMRRRHGLLRLFNTVSRVYFGARRRGPCKLMRFLLGMPDMFINIAGRDLHDPVQYALMVSVVAHEFAHVWGCRDQYRFRDDAKRRPNVADGDLMYRTGPHQRLQPYHIQGLCACAKRGKLPVRGI